jgi:SAM-dependent methyltransferase
MRAMSATEQQANACRICGTSGGEPVISVRSAHESTWLACAGCGVQRIHPYPTPEALAAYYDDSYLDNDGFADVGFSVSHKLRYSRQYAERVNEEYAWSLGDVGITVGAETRVLDYGCADGAFLDFLVTRGCDPTLLCGIDISPQMIAMVNAKGLRGLTPERQDDVIGEQFDLITLWDVIEHVPDPVATLSWLRPLLAAGGRLLMQTPRVGLLAEALGERFEHYLPLEHLHLFTRDALCTAGEQAGFEVARCASFGANAPGEQIPQPYKLAYDRLAKATDNGATQLVVLSH